MATQPQQITLDKESMFAKTPVYKVGENIVFGLRRESILPNDTDVIIEIIQPWEDRLDLLATEMFDSPHLWWAIAELNHLIDPLTEVKTGVELRIPTKERLLNLLES